MRILLCPSTCRRTKEICRLALVGLAVAVGTPSWGILITRWTFESSTLTTAGPFAPETGTGEARGATGGTYSSVAGPGSAKAYSSNNWNTGEYWQFLTSSTGYQDLVVSFNATGSNTGPRDFAFSYSTNGTTYTTFDSYSLINAGWSALSAPVEPELSGSTFSFNLSSVTSIDNAATVYFRLTQVGTTSIAGLTVAGTGTSRVDNFAVSGNPFVAAIPEPTAPLVGLLLAGGLGATVARRAGRG